VGSGCGGIRRVVSSFGGGAVARWVRMRDTFYHTYSYQYTVLFWCVEVVWERDDGA
jgi:hypothetical protein